MCQWVSTCSNHVRRMKSSDDFIAQLNFSTRSIFLVLRGYLLGLLCSLNIFRVLIVLGSNRSACLSVLTVVGANLGLVVGSDLARSSLLIPSIRWFGFQIFSHQPPEWVESLCSFLFKSLWLFPIWSLLYLAINIPNYSELATTAMKRREPIDRVARNSSAEEEAYRYFFFFLLLLQKYSFQALLGRFSFGPCFLFTTLLHSLYAFDYAWASTGVLVPKRLVIALPHLTFL